MGKLRACAAWRAFLENGLRWPDGPDSGPLDNHGLTTPNNTWVLPGIIIMMVWEWPIRKNYHRAARTHPGKHTGPLEYTRAGGTYRATRIQPTGPEPTGNYRNLPEVTAESHERIDGPPGLFQLGRASQKAGFCWAVCPSKIQRAEGELGRRPSGVLGHRGP